MNLFGKKGPRPETVERVKEFAWSECLKTPEEIEEEKWEQRRWELVRHLVAQDRRSVVLGKLQATPRAIARKARELADAAIIELRTNKIDNHGRETDNKSV